MAYNRSGNSTVESIFIEFLMQKSHERRTLTAVNEHGKLFRSNTPLTRKFLALKYVDDLASWSNDSVGSCLVLTGTAHAKYELTYMERSYRDDSVTVVFVGPLSEEVFPKLVEDVMNLSPAAIGDLILATNRVPRELMLLSSFIEKYLESDRNDPELIKRVIARFEAQQTTGFFREIKKFYDKIKSEVDRKEFYQGLAQTFLHALEATDLIGQAVKPAVIDFDDYGVMSRQKHSLGPGKEKFLARGYLRYPRFDFMIGSMFMQVSISEFGNHNKNTADFRCAFERPYKNDPDNRNQIECYLDEMFGMSHSAGILQDGTFSVYKLDPKAHDEKIVSGFRFVYICGSQIDLKKHTELVKELPEVALISFAELKRVLFRTSSNLSFEWFI
ncbi:hypothetical protein BGZ76_004057 [Entomortierella beljakovae]|nr:hypothetical protein BGZ76_004057 [Entomortierella beljakovae]